MATSDLVRLEVKSREGSGKEAAKRLRADGYAPGIVYGLNKEPHSVSIQEMVLAKALQKAGGKSLIEIAIDGADGEPVVIQEVQREPLSRMILHIDFKRLDLAKASTFTINLEFTGESIGVKDGGVLNVIEYSIEIECLPTELPNSIVADISELNVGDGLHARDLVLPEGVLLKTEPAAMLVNVVAPAAEVEEEVPVEEEEVAAVEGEEPAEKPEGEPEEKPEGGKPAWEKKERI